MLCSCSQIHQAIRMFPSKFTDISKIAIRMSYNNYSDVDGSPMPKRANLSPTAPMGMANEYNTPLTSRVVKKDNVVPVPSAPFPTPIVPVQAMTSEIMTAYLDRQEELDCQISIFHPMAVQLSYNNEKRFFGLPPCIYLDGKGWHEKIKRSGKLFAFFGIHNAIGRDQMQEISLDEYFGAVKDMYVSVSYNLKYCRLTLELNHESGHKIGSFITDKIKVISKPSKQKRTDTQSEIHIKSGTQIGLFHRNKQHTRYLFSENGKAVASLTKWASFTIDVVDELLDNKEYMTTERYVYYGDLVSIVDEVRGCGLPNVRIRKVENQIVQVGEPSEGKREPVSQLHKCAFQIENSERSYLLMKDSQIGYHKAKGTDKHEIHESAAWTIVSSCVKEFRFCEMMGPSSHPVSSSPRVIDFMENEKTISFVGLNFTSNMKVWIGATETETYMLSPVSLICITPLLSKIEKEWSGFKDSGCHLPISIVRDDGVIFPIAETIRLRSSI